MSDQAKGDTSHTEVSRRTFLKGVGTILVTSAAAPAVLAADKVAQLEKLGADDQEHVQGPGAVPISLRVNGKELKLTVEPRVTLLDALRNYSGLTGAKEVCDRATCGACTVLLDGRPTYSCSMLAIEAQGLEITTIEGLSSGRALTDVQKAFVECDALMCGYCTPGFVMSVTALLKKNPHPTADEVRIACSGNLCRCGTQPRILKAALQVAGVATADRSEVIRYV